MISSTSSTISRWMLLRPQESARSLSQTVARLMTKAKISTGQSKTIGEMPNALIATISLAPETREKTVVQASRRVMGTVTRSVSGRKYGDQAEGWQHGQPLRRGLAANKAQHHHQGQRDDRNREDLDHFDEDVTRQDCHGRFDRCLARTRHARKPARGRSTQGAGSFLPKRARVKGNPRATFPASQILPRTGYQATSFHRLPHRRDFTDFR